jgi:hypothetical protein
MSDELVSVDSNELYRQRRQRREPQLHRHGGLALVDGYEHR